MTTIYSFPQFEPQPDESEYPFPCTMCHRAFSVASNLKRHVKSVHSREKPFACNYCDRQFSQRCNLKRHERIHTGEKPYTCFVCGCSFSDQTVYKAHMFRHRKPLLQKEQIFYNGVNIVKSAEKEEEEEEEEDTVIIPIAIRPIMRKVAGEIGTSSSCFSHVKENFRQGVVMNKKIQKIIGSDCSAFSKVDARFCDSSSLSSELSDVPGKSEDWNSNYMSR